jgi:hypothetical protein
MVKTILVTIALSNCLAIGLVSTASATDRKEVREAAGVEAGDRVDRRREVRDNVEADVSNRKEVREAAGVEAGDRVDRRREVREAID